MVSRYSQLHADILTQSDAQEQLLQDWVLWQRGRGMSDKTITDRLTIIRRVPDAATITPQGVDRFLTSAAWAKATRANYHALRHWFGSALREAGVDSLVIKELMGHESLATTAIYVDVPLKQRTAAVDRLPLISTGWARSSFADEHSQLSLFD